MLMARIAQDRDVLRVNHIALRVFAVALIVLLRMRMTEEVVGVKWKRTWGV